MSDQTAVHQVAIAGEFNIFTAVAVRDQLLSALAAADDVEVDLAQVTEIDSAGLQLMIAAKREAAQRNKMLRFAGHSPAVADILDLTDMSALLADNVHSGS